MSSSLGAITLDSLSRGLVHCFEVSRRNGARPLMTSLPPPHPLPPTSLPLSNRRPQSTTTGPRRLDVLHSPPPPPPSSQGNDLTSFIRFFSSTSPQTMAMQFLRGDFRQAGGPSKPLSEREREGEGSKRRMARPAVCRETTVGCTSG